MLKKVHTSTINRNENMVWTDSQDYGADEILYTARIVLFDKINRLIREIIILFEVYPQLFHADVRWKTSSTLRFSRRFRHREVDRNAHCAMVSRCWRLPLARRRNMNTTLWRPVLKSTRHKHGELWYNIGRISRKGKR